MKNILSNTYFSGVALLLLLTLSSSLASAQEITNEFQPRTSLQLSCKPIKKLKLSIAPELRFEDSLSVDKYQIHAQADYKVKSGLKLDASYRIIGNIRKNDSTEYSGRYAFSAKYSKDILRFTPMLRLRYTNDADDESTNKNYLRYKANVEYNIKKCKLTPFIGTEAFHQLNNNRIHKMRYSGGFEYKLLKNNYIGLCYKFDYYRYEYLNRHILSLEYKLKF